MKYNEQVESRVKRFLSRGKVAANMNGSATISTETLMKRRSSLGFHGGSTKFRQGVLQLMIHTVDPTVTGDVDPDKYKREWLQTLDSNNLMMNGVTNTATAAVLSRPNTPPPGTGDLNNLSEDGVADNNQNAKKLSSGSATTAGGNVPAIQVTQVGLDRVASKGKVMQSLS
jgi:hypothetical protein